MSTVAWMFDDDRPFNEPVLYLCPEWSRWLKDRMFGRQKALNEALIDRGSGVSMWRQIETIFAKEIGVGDLAEGSPLPTENDLANRERSGQAVFGEPPHDPSSRRITLRPGVGSC